MGRKLEAGWRQFQLLFARQVTWETSSSRAGQTNIFQFFVWLATGQTFGYFLWTDSDYRKQDIILKIGNEIGGTPALLLPDGKGRRRGGENPAGGARGGRRCEGELRFFLQNANISSSSQSTRELWIGGRLHVHVPVFSREESESEKV